VARQYLVVDVEATCWENQPALARESETVEIGAVLLDPDTGSTRAELQSFVRPVRHPVLSPFCTRLTTVTQADVDGAPLFPEALARLGAEILDRHQVLLATWGDYDRRQLERDCKHHRVKYPFGKRHLDVKQLFAERWHCRPCGMFQALEMARLGLEGTHHRALDDARNITRLLLQLLR
jgi:inhibitor of KinA sporulation pathway (predicted exonuclease)